MTTAKATGLTASLPAFALANLSPRHKQFDQRMRDAQLREKAAANSKPTNTSTPHVLNREFHARTCYEQENGDLLLSLSTARDSSGVVTTKSKPEVAPSARSLSKVTHTVDYKSRKPVASPSKPHGLVVKPVLLPKPVKVIHSGF